MAVPASIPTPSGDARPAFTPSLTSDTPPDLTPDPTPDPTPPPEPDFHPDPAGMDEFLEDLCSPFMSLQQIAGGWETSVAALIRYIQSEDGLEAIGGAEFAMAARLRVAALAALPNVVATVSYILQEYSREEARVPLKNTIDGINLLETKRANARKAGLLLHRLANYHPRPVRPFSVRPPLPSPVPSPVPPVRRSSGATGVDVPAAPQSNAACACHDHLPLCEDDRGSSPSQCGMPKRPLGHGEAHDISISPTPSVAASTTADVVAVPLTISACACHDHLPLCEDGRGSSHSQCGMPKRPLEHGDATDISSSATPSVAASTTTDVIAVPLTISACACHDHLPLCEDGRDSSASLCELKRPLEHGEASELETASPAVDSATLATEAEACITLASPTIIASRPAMIVAPQGTSSPSRAAPATSPPQATSLHSGP